MPNYIRVANLRKRFIEEQGLQDEYTDWFKRQPKDAESEQDTEDDRPFADSYVDGDEIRVNITDSNSSVLLSFKSEKAYKDFCSEVTNLEGRAE